MIIAMSLPEIATSAPPDVQAFNSQRITCDGIADWWSPKDFRLISSSPTLQRKFEDGKINHLDPAISRMDDGNYNLNVIADLDFLLRRWPNHYLALQALIKFEAGGGRTISNRPAICYFEWARRFAPDDVNVLILQGLYFYNKQDHAMAEAAWQSALQIDPGSPDAHYNLGLLYFGAGKFDDALKHGRAAYDSGFPLPGLKNKLVKAGQWTGDID